MNALRFSIIATGPARLTRSALPSWISRALTVLAWTNRVAKLLAASGAVGGVTPGWIATASLIGTIAQIGAAALRAYGERSGSCISGGTSSMCTSSASSEPAAVKAAKREACPPSS